MANIVPPDIVARGQSFRLVRDDNALERFNGSEQIISNRVAYWAFDIPVLPRSNVEAKRWRASLVDLANPANTFEATPPGYRGSAYAQARSQPIGPLQLSNSTNLALNTGQLLFINPGFSGGGEALVNGPGQLGKVLNIRDADPNEILFRVGEYFSINGELKVVTAQCTTDSIGQAQVQFDPPLRAAPADGDELNMAQPFASFRVVDPSWTLQPNRLHSFTLQAIESY